VTERNRWDEGSEPSSGNVHFPDPPAEASHPSTTPPRKWTRRVIITTLSVFGALLALGAVLQLAGYETDEQQAERLAAEAAIDRPNTVATTAPAPAPGATSGPVTTSAPTAAPIITAAPAQATQPTTNDLTMPDLRCSDLQDAQDLMQELTGQFFAVDSYDASGAGRAQLIDSNWTVVEQSPAPGERIGGDPKIGAVKDDEIATCSPAELPAIAEASGGESVATPDLTCIPGTGEMIANANCVDPWPFTVPEAVLVCRDEGLSAGVRIGGTTYAINGFASGHQERLGWEDIDDHRELWRNDGAFDGLKISIGNAISVARSLCV